MACIFSIIVILTVAATEAAFVENRICHDMIEGLTEWTDGASMNIRLDSVDRPDWAVQLSFDRPLHKFQVFNGKMDTQDITNYMIRPVNYHRSFPSNIFLNTLVQYDEAHGPAKLQAIDVNGVRFRCTSDTRGALRDLISSEDISYQTRQASEKISFENVAENQVPCADGEKNCNGTVSSTIECNKKGNEYECTKTDIFNIEQTDLDCPKDKLEWFCPFFKEDCEKEERKPFMSQFCFNTCFCSGDAKGRSQLGDREGMEDMIHHQYGMY